MKVFLVFDEWINEGEYEDQRYGETYLGTYDTVAKAISRVNEIVDKIHDSIKQCFDLNISNGCSITFELRLPDNGTNVRNRDNGVIEHDVCYLRECATDIYHASDVETKNHTFYIKEVEVE